MYNGLEIDVLSLGDADCSIVTQWNDGIPYRVLIDGGCGGDAETVTEFLRARQYTNLWAVVCTHMHNDHASGLIKVVQSPHITIHNGWMHDLRRHVSPDGLRRVCASRDSVCSAVDTTRALSEALSKRGIPIHEPFVGACVAGYPNMFVLGPSRKFYEGALEEFADVKLPGLSQPDWTTAIAGALSNPRRLTGLTAFPVTGGSSYGNLAALVGNPLAGVVPPLTGLLDKLSIETDPDTQPFNSTSVILGVRSGTCKMLLTADAGSDALAFVSADWNHLAYLGVPHHGSDGNLSQADAERFCPEYAFISAKGDGSHPSPSVVNALIKVGAKVASTHSSGNLHFSHGMVPARPDYVPVVCLKGAVQPDPRALFIKALVGRS